MNKDVIYPTMVIRSQAETIELQDKEIERLNNIIDGLEKDLWKVRQLTFTKYNSNEWNNCLSFNDDILPIIKRIKELKEGK